MAEFQLSREQDTPQFLREMAMYFIQFSPEPSNAYCQLVRMLRPRNNSIAFATLNYDVLLEHAISIEGHTLCYNCPASPGSSNFEIIKPHGSCNFLPNLPSKVTGLTFLGAPNATGAHIYGPIRPATTTDEVRNFCKSNDVLAPAMALYTQGKRLLTSGPFMELQLRRFEDAVKRAHRLILVGVAVNADDRHIWFPIQESKAKIYFVDPNAAMFSDWAKSTGRRHVYQLGNDFLEALPRIQGLLRA